jgi:hypothetical protein
LPTWPPDRLLPDLTGAEFKIASYLCHQLEKQAVVSTAITALSRGPRKACCWSVAVKATAPNAGCRSPRPLRPKDLVKPSGVLSAAISEARLSCVAGVIGIYLYWKGILPFREQRSLAGSLGYCGVFRAANRLRRSGGHVSGAHQEEVVPLLQLTRRVLRKQGRLQKIKGLQHR